MLKYGSGITLTDRLRLRPHNTLSGARQVINQRTGQGMNEPRILSPKQASRSRYDFIRSYYDGIETDMQKFSGSYLSRLRKQSGKTQNRLARQLLCSVNALSQVENGAVFQHMNLFCKLCHEFGCQPTDLLEQARLSCLLQQGSLAAVFPDKSGATTIPSKTSPPDIDNYAQRDES